MRGEGALQIQRLEGSPGGLWDLYLDEPVLIVREVDVVVGALWFQLLMAERMVMGGASESLEHTTILRSEKCETQRQGARRSTREIRGWGCGFMRRIGSDEAEIGAGVAARRGARQSAWFRRKADIATARPVHALCVGSPSPRMGSASSGLPVALRWRRERCR
jgi:hypothetical protein